MPAVLLAAILSPVAFTSPPPQQCVNNVAISSYVEGRFVPHSNGASSFRY